MEGIDISMMGVALPSIRAELGMSTAELQWVVSGYVLGYGGFVLLGGRASDLLGRRRMFLLWLVVFLAFSGLGGLAIEGSVLIVARFMTGVAAGFMTPASLSIITTMFPEGPRRNKALGVYAGIAAGGFSLGMVAGGLLTAISWRWVFFAPVIMAVVILVGAVWLIPREPRLRRPAGKFDLTGAASVTGAMLLFVYTIVMAPEVAVAQTAVTFAASVGMLLVFIQIERRSAAPLLRLGILRSAPLVRANIGAMILAGSFIGFQFIVVLYLRELRGWSEVKTGLILAFAGIDTILAPTVTPRLVNRFGAHRVAVTGLFLAAVAYTPFLFLDLDWGLAAILPSVLVVGVAFALAFGPLTIAATDGVAEDEQGLAGGVLSSSFQFGSALGLAAVTAVAVAMTEPGGPAQTVLGYRAALTVPVVAAVAGVVVVASGLRRRSGDRAQDRSGDHPPGAAGFVEAAH